MKIEFDGYYWRPTEFSALADAKKLSRSARAFYRELLDASWHPDRLGTVPMEHAKLAELTGWPLKVVQQVMGELNDEAFLLLGLDPIWGRPCYHLSAIRDQAGEYQRAMERRARERQNEAAQRESLLKPASKPLAEDRMPFLTVPIGERQLSSFRGWLPTATFNSRGQVVPVDEDLVNALYEAYPSVDVRGEIERMFDWLKANPARRPTVMTMGKFITGWLTRTSMTTDRGVPSNSSVQSLVEELLLGVAD